MTENTYVTKQGDTWDSAAFLALGGCQHTHRLMWANRRHLDYLTFPAGITLTLPAEDSKAQPSSSDLPWKGASG